MAISSKDIVGLVVAAILAGVLLPIGLIDLVNIANAAVTVNGTAASFGDIAPAAITTLIGTVVPIIIVISVLLGFLRND